MIRETEFLEHYLLVALLSAVFILTVFSFLQVIYMYYPL